MKFTKRETEFMEWLDAVVDAELDLETSINVDGKFIKKDFNRIVKLRKDFFKWFVALKPDGRGKSGTHGMTYTRFYNTWRCMINRCKIKTMRYYKNGVRVCDSWKIFKNFMADMYKGYAEHVDKYGEADTTIDRINNSGGYSPDNCRWATRKEQVENKTKKYKHRQKNA